MKPSVATYFSGFGLSDIGAMQAGYQPVLSVEYNPNPKIGKPDAIAAVYAENLGDKHLRVEPVQDVPENVLRSLEGVDLFMASPPCIRASVANAQGGETELDGILADAVIRAIRLMMPQSFILENVMGYRSFAAYRAITDCLDALGYWWVDEVVNSADFGVAQTRKRLILRASRTGFVRPFLSRTHKEGGGNSLLPWNGWYGAIEDLLPGCPETDLADWQKKRIPEELKTLLVNGIPDNYREYAVSPLASDSESPTLTASVEKHPMRAVLVEGDAAGDRCPSLLSPEEPAFTLKTGGGVRLHRTILTMPNGAGESCMKETMEPDGSIVSDHSSGSYRAVLIDQNNTAREPSVRVKEEPSFTVISTMMRRPSSTPFTATENENGVRIVALTPRCLARFQSIPDWYKLPEKKGLACTGIGNGVAVNVARVAAEEMKP
jgi:DNA-cytosine methyltransferase